MPARPVFLLLSVALLTSCAALEPASSDAVARKASRGPARPEAERVVPAIAAAPIPRVLACAGSAARDADGKIDVDQTLAALVKVGCNAYLYDLPADSDAWARLPRFADAAQRKGIAVYVYLAPFTLARKGGESRQDGPFGKDYVKWCAGVAKLAADHPAIAGVVMDDFASNVGEGKFTVDYVRRMRDALTSGGRALRWLPVLYFSLPLNETLSEFGPVFPDGAILAYPRAGRELDVANLNLNDAPRGASFGTDTPKHKLLKIGQGTFARATLPPEMARRASHLSFFVNDQNATDRRARHRLVARVDGRTVWEHEVADENFAEQVTVPLRTSGQCEIQIGVLADETQADEVAIVHIAFDDVSVLDTSGRRIQRVAWREGLEDGLEIGIVPPHDDAAPQRWRVPMTLLVAGAPFEHAKRYDEPGKPEAIAGRVGNALDWLRAGKTNGVVVWYLPLDATPAAGTLNDAVADKMRAAAN